MIQPIDHKSTGVAYEFCKSTSGGLEDILLIQNYLDDTGYLPIP